jgi:Ni/Co efflux regulator RcnB
LKHFWHSALLCAALMAPVALQAQDHHDQVYHDRDHNDDHHWDSHEDKAYRIYVKENHRKNNAFTRLKDDEQQAYWKWRHEHSDEQLKITIRK